MSVVLPVPRTERLSVDAFRTEFVDRGLPVLIHGLLDDWPARTTWSAASLRERFGGLSVPVRDYTVRGDGKPYRTAPMRLAEYLDWWEALDPTDAAPTPNLYLAEWNFAKACPQLLQDFRVPDLFAHDWMDELPPNVRFERQWIFVGHAAVGTPTHTDTFSTSAWLAMVRGTKALRLLAPDQGAHVTRGIDLFDPATAERLVGQGAVLWEAILDEGTTLFIPGRWYHQVRNVDKNIMVTKNFVDTPNLLQFLSDFETRLVGPLAEIRRLRNRFCGAPGADPVPAGLSSETFVEHQLQWVDDMTRDLDAYRKVLEARRR